MRRTLGLAHTAPRGGRPARHAHRAEPAPAVPPGICDGRITNGQQSTDPNGAGDRRPPVPSRPDGGSARRPSDIRVRGETPSPAGGAPLDSRSATRGGRGEQTGMEDQRGGCSKQGATRWEARWAPSGAFQGGEAVGIPTEWRVPSSNTPRETPGGRPGGGTRSTPTNGRLRDRKPVSTSWLLTKLPTRHLSYISTDLFWTKFSTANLQMAFLPLGAQLFVWEEPIYIQSHKNFPIQKGCGSVNQKFWVKMFKSAQATNWPVCTTNRQLQATNWPL